MNPQGDRVLRNVDRMRRMGAADDEIRRYLVDVEGFQPRADPVATAPQPAEQGGWFSRGLPDIDLAGTDETLAPVRAVGQGASLGFSDEIVGGLRGMAKGIGKLLPAALRGGMQGGVAALPAVGEEVQAGIADERAKLGEYRRQRPVMSRALEFAGGAATGAALPLGGALTAGRAAAGGALAGGLTAAGTAEGGLASRTAAAVPGAVLGAAVGGAAGKLAGRLASGRNAGAKSTLLRNLSRDDKNPLEAMIDVATSDKPLLLADVGGKNVRDLTKVVAQTPSKGKRIQNIVQGRAADAEGRILTDLAQTSGQGRRINILDSIDEIADAQSQEASKLYGAIRDTPVEDSRVRELFNLDPFRKAYERARNIGRNANAARVLRGEAAAPELPAAEELANTPLTLGLLDEVKRGLDDLIGAGKREAGGLGNQELGTLRELKNAFVGVLDDRVPDYAKARSAYAGKAALQNALDEGRSVFKAPLDELERTVRGMGGSELDAFRKGAVEALADRVEGITQGRDVARNIGGKTAMQKRIRLLFPDDKAFSAFRDRIRQEAMMASNKNAITGGSDTAPKALILADMLGETEGLGGVQLSPKYAALRFLVGKARNARTARMADDLEPYLSAQGDDLRKLLAELAGFADKEPQRQTLRSLAGRTAGFGAGVAAGVPFAPSRRP